MIVILAMSQPRQGRYPSPVDTRRGDSSSVTCYLSIRRSSAGWRVASSNLIGITKVFYSQNEEPR